MVTFLLITLFLSCLCFAVGWICNSDIGPAFVMLGYFFFIVAIFGTCGYGLLKIFGT